MENIKNKNNISGMNRHLRSFDANGMSTIEQQVMRQVRRIHRLRQFTSTTAYALYGACILLYVLLSLVSVRSVVANMPTIGSPMSVVDFMVRATLNTETAVQVTILGLGALLITALVRSILHNMRASAGVLTSIRV